MKQNGFVYDDLPSYHLPVRARLLRDYYCSHAGAHLIDNEMILTVDLRSESEAGPLW